MIKQKVHFVGLLLSHQCCDRVLRYFLIKSGIFEPDQWSNSLARHHQKMFVTTFTKKFLNSDKVDSNKLNSIAHKLNSNQFHKQLRNELIMLPIPKAKFFKAKVPAGVDPEDFEDEIIGKQTHVLENAMNRVSQRL